MNTTNPKFWPRPKTQKIYLHAPLAQRVVLMWPTMMVSNLDFADNGKHTRQDSTAMILLNGEQAEQFDYNETRFAPVNGSVPIYTALQKQDCVDIAMEAFCSMDRNPGVYLKVTLTNTGNYTADDCIGLLARTGDDQYINNNQDTGYNDYEPNVGTWFLLKKNWTHDGLNATDGHARISVRATDNICVEWVEPVVEKFAADRYFRFRYALEPGETATFWAAQGWEKDVSADNYELQRAQTEAAWAQIHAQVQLEPVTDNPVYQKVYRSMITQCLQMLARYPDKELVVPRQGDVGCYIWPWEAASFLIPLDRVGLHQYTAPAYQYLIERWFHAGGEDDGKIMSNHQQWGRLNGSVIWGISEHLLYTRDQAEYEYYVPYLDRMLAWMERQRAKTQTIPGKVYGGIFPAMKASDWPEVTQHWTSTDTGNLEGLEAMVRLYETFDNPNAAYVRGVYEDYLGAMKAIAADIYKGHEDDEAFIFPHQLCIPFEETETSAFAVGGALHLFDFKVLDVHSRAFEQMERWMQDKGFQADGLVGRMSNCGGGNHGRYARIYYTVNGEVSWIRHYKARGENEKAAKTFRALMKYCMTPEYIVSERYCPDCVWFSPWQPNASASGRILRILLDWFGERRPENVTAAGKANIAYTPVSGTAQAAPAPSTTQDTSDLY